MRPRILAMVGAVALVVVAVFVRSLISDGGSGNTDGGGGGRPVVACTPDLQGICDALAADGAIARDTPPLDLAEAADPPEQLDGWITWDPAPGIANFDAEQASQDRPWHAGSPLGTSPLAVAIRAPGGPALPRGCTQIDFTWGCLVEAAKETPPLGVGIGTGTTAESLMRFYPIAASLLDDPASGFNQIDGSAVRAVIDSPADGRAVQKPFGTQLDRQRAVPGVFDLVVGPVAAMDDVSGLAVITPKGTPAQATVVLAPRRTASSRLLANAFRSAAVQQALRDAGVAPGTGKLAPDDRAGDLYAVRDKVG